jgi:hypothetical protein
MDKDIHNTHESTKTKSTAYRRPLHALLVVGYRGHLRKRLVIRRDCTCGGAGATFPLWDSDHFSGVSFYRRYLIIINKNAMSSLPPHNKLFSLCLPSQITNMGRTSPL